MVYALCDPTTYEWRYVGKTRKTLEGRLREHLQKAALRPKTYRDHWIRSLQREGKVPVIQLLDVVSLPKLDNVECDWIVNLRLLGCRLTNMTDGGEGGDTGGKPPVRCGEMNNKAKLNEEQVIWLRREARKGRDMAGLGRRLGVSPTTAWCAATGRTWHHVSEMPMKSVPRQRLSDADIAAIRKLSAEGIRNRDLSRQFQIHQSHVSKIVGGHRHSLIKLPRS